MTSVSCRSLAYSHSSLPPGDDDDDYDDGKDDDDDNNYDDDDDDYGDDDNDDHPALHPLPREEDVGRVVEDNL